MAITWAVTINKKHVWGDQYAIDCTFAATGTYTITTGDPFTAAQCSLDVVDIVLDATPDGSVAQTNGTAQVAFDLTNMKIRLFGTGTASTDAFNEIGNATTMTGFTFHALVMGV